MNKTLLWPHGGVGRPIVWMTSCTASFMSCMSSFVTRSVCSHSPTPLTIRAAHIDGNPHETVPVPTCTWANCLKCTLKPKTPQTCPYQPHAGVLSIARGTFNYVLMTYTVLIYACMYTKTPIACFLFRLKNPDKKPPHTCLSQPHGGYCLHAGYV